GIAPLSVPSPRGRLVSWTASRPASFTELNRTMDQCVLAVGPPRKRTRARLYTGRRAARHRHRCSQCGRGCPRGYHSIWASRAPALLALRSDHLLYPNYPQTSPKLPVATARCEVYDVSTTQMPPRRCRSRGPAKGGSVPMQEQNTMAGPPP